MPFDGSGAKSGRSPLYVVAPLALVTGLALLATADSSHAGLGDLAHAEDTGVASAPHSGAAAAAPDGSAPTTTDVAEDGVLRVAAAQTSFSGESAAEVRESLEGGGDQALQDLSSLVQDTRPDVLVLTGVPYDGTHQLAELLNAQYLSVDQGQDEGLPYAYMYTAATNSGIDSGADLDGDGFIGGEGDALGRGDYPGEYGMIVLSQAPIDEDEVRTFQDFLWDDMPQNVMPQNTPQVERTVRPLYDSTLWDVPLTVEDRTVHLLAAARTSAGFSETDPSLMVDQRRFLDDYLSEDPADAEYIYDDLGDYGGFGGDRWIVAGDDGLGGGTVRSDSELPEEDSDTEEGEESRLTWTDLSLD